MVAKINRNSSLYGVLIYNQKKLEDRSARIISGNRMITDLANIPDNVMQRTMLSFENYLLANRKTEKPILHISLNPSPKDRLSDEQFADIADNYMEKMGYGNQPYIVYMHEDTGRKHIHIVSTCVDENGIKIDDAYEWRRSMQACRELEEKYGLKQVADKKNELAEPYLKNVDYKKGDVKLQVSNTLKTALSTYKFQSFGEYCALLACFNIDAKTVKGDHNGQPYTGVVYTVTNDKGKPVSPPFKSSLFGKEFGHAGLVKKMNRHTASYKQKKWGPKIHEDIRHAMSTCGGKQKNFMKIMRSKGIDVAFRKNDDGRIYGVTFIDHNSKEVYNGSRLGKEFSANNFEKLFTNSGNSLKSQPDSGNYHSSDKESLIEQVFGLFPSDQPDDFIPPDDLMPIKKRKKKKKRSQGMS